MIPSEYRIKYNKSVTAHCRWQRTQKRWAIVAFMGLPEIALIGLLGLPKYVFIIIVAQMVFGVYKMFDAIKQMQRYEGPLIDMDI
jgi:hypothetical protein